MTALLREFWLFVRAERKWWMIPMLVVLAAVGILVVVASVNPALAPFIYPLV